jgi:hypothetical protein
MSRPYQPSNGSEECWFTERFCWQCRREPTHGGCPIMVAAMLVDVEDPRYPKEWCHDQAGRPTCTAFEDVRTPGRPKDVPGQLRLFGVKEG